MSGQNCGQCEILVFRPEIVQKTPENAHTQADNDWIFSYTALHIQTFMFVYVNESPRFICKADLVKFYINQQEFILLYFKAVLVH